MLKKLFQYAALQETPTFNDLISVQNESVVAINIGFSNPWQLNKVVKYLVIKEKAYKKYVHA